MKNYNELTPEKQIKLKEFIDEIVTTEVLKQLTSENLGKFIIINDNTVTIDLRIYNEFILSEIISLTTINQF